MASPAAPVPDAGPTPPAADPAAIRACLTPRLRAEFDSEWDLVLDQAKQTKELSAIHELLNKWRHIAYAELTDPGSYFRMLAKAEQIMRTGENPEAAPLDEMNDILRKRRGQ